LFGRVGVARREEAKCENRTRKGDLFHWK
jgi:hypothetical protein